MATLSGKTLSIHSAAEWLFWHQLPGFSVRKLLHLQEKVGNLAVLVNSPIKQLAALGLKEEAIKYLTSVSVAHFEHELQRLHDENIQLVHWGGEFYPPLLSEINSPPLLLFVKGNLRLLTSPQIAVVGSRNPTYHGARNSFDFANSLAQLGLTVTSGLAAGIDKHAHLGCFAAADNTVAVIGTGLDIQYPRENTALHHEIALRGLLVSEFALGTKPKAANFPRRNRLISGMSLGVLVVEAAVKSGSLITASMALNENREVFAIPGSIHSPRSKGCHSLLRQGAKLVENVQDILEELPHPVNRQLLIESKQEDRQEDLCLEGDFQIIYDCLGYTSVTVDEIHFLTGLPIKDITAKLAHFELQGIVAADESGYVRIKETQYERTRT